MFLFITYSQAVRSKKTVCTNTFDKLVPAIQKLKSKEGQKLEKIPRLCQRTEKKKLMTKTSIRVLATGTILDNLKKRVGELKIRCSIACILTTELVR